MSANGEVPALALPKVASTNHFQIQPRPRICRCNSFHTSSRVTLRTHCWGIVDGMSGTADIL
jgi:hypothetical protein